MDLETTTERGYLQEVGSRVHGECNSHSNLCFFAEPIYAIVALRRDALHDDDDDDGGSGGGDLCG